MHERRRAGRRLGVAGRRAVPRPEAAILVLRRGQRDEVAVGIVFRVRHAGLVHVAEAEVGPAVRAVLDEIGHHLKVVVALHVAEVGVFVPDARVVERKVRSRDLVLPADDDRMSVEFVLGTRPSERRVGVFYFRF